MTNHEIEYGLSRDLLEYRGDEIHIANEMPDSFYMYDELEIECARLEREALLEANLGATLIMDADDKITALPRVIELLHEMESDNIVIREEAARNVEEERWERVLYLVPVESRGFLKANRSTLTRKYPSLSGSLESVAEDLEITQMHMLWLTSQMLDKYYVFPIEQETTLDDVEWSSGESKEVFARSKNLDELIRLNDEHDLWWQHSRLVNIGEGEWELRYNPEA